MNQAGLLYVGCDKQLFSRAAFNPDDHLQRTNLLFRQMSLLKASKSVFCKEPE